VQQEDCHTLGIAGGDFSSCGLQWLASFLCLFLIQLTFEQKRLSTVSTFWRRGSKWVKEGTVDAAVRFMTDALPEIIDDLPIVSPGKKKGSPTSVAKGPAGSPGITSKNLRSHLDSLSLDDPDTCVAKVTPDRIYIVACHPSPDTLIVCAGDKKGYLGIWNVDQYGAPKGDELTTGASATDGVHLFKPFSGAISSMAWNNSGTTLLASSYDGSVRAFDANKQVFEQVFATYDDHTHVERAYNVVLEAS